MQSIRVKSDREMLTRMVGVITAQETENVIMNQLVNPVLAAYLQLLKKIVR